MYGKVGFTDGLVGHHFIYFILFVPHKKAALITFKLDLKMKEPQEENESYSKILA